MGYELGVDVGTTFTAAAIHDDDGARILPLSADSPMAPSLVGIHPNGSIVVGAAASALADYDRRLVANAFKRQMGDPTPIVVAGTPYDASWYMAQVLGWVVDNATHQRGERPRSVAVTHPANWHSHKITRMQQSVGLANLDPNSTMLLTEPEAAAVAYANENDVAIGETLVVYDLGGGTFDTAVLRREAAGFDILGRPQGMERLGGLDFDAAVYRYVTDRLGPAFNKLDTDDPVVSRQMVRLKLDCIAAKEALSFQTQANIDIAVGPIRQRVELTRANFESLIQPVLMESIGAVRRVLSSAELNPDHISRILLAGGSSRIPLVSEIISSEMGREVSVDAEPKQVVALGAAYAAAANHPSEKASSEAATNGHLVDRQDPSPVPLTKVTPPKPDIPVIPLELSLENTTTNGRNGHNGDNGSGPSQARSAPPVRPADPAPSKTTRSNPPTRRPPSIIDDANQAPKTANSSGAPMPQHRSEPPTEVAPSSAAPSQPDPHQAPPPQRPAPTPIPTPASAGTPPPTPTPPTPTTKPPSEQSNDPSVSPEGATPETSGDATPADSPTPRPGTPPQTEIPKPETPQPEAPQPEAPQPETPQPETVQAAQAQPAQREPGVGQPPSNADWHQPTGEHILGTTTGTVTPEPTRPRRAIYIAVAGLLLILTVGLAVVVRGILDRNQPQEAGGVPTSMAEAGSWPSSVTMSIKTVPGVNIERLVMVQILEDELGIDIDVRPSTSYEGVADDLTSGVAALGVLDPFNYSLATGAGAEIEPAAVRIVDTSDPGYTHSYGLTAVDNDNVRSIEDFDSGAVCFADRDSLSGFRIPAAGLETIGVDLASPSSPVIAQIAGSQASAVRFIGDGTCPAGFVSSEAVEELLLSGDLAGLADATGEVGETNPNDAMVKVVWLSPKIMNGPLTMSAALPQSLRDAIAETLVEKGNRDWAAANGYCGNSDSSCTINSEGSWGYATAVDPDFDGLRRLCRPASQSGCRP